MIQFFEKYLETNNEKFSFWRIERIAYIPRRLWPNARLWSLLMTGKNLMTDGAPSQIMHFRFTTEVDRQFRPKPKRHRNRKNCQFRRRNRSRISAGLYWQLLQDVLIIYFWLCRLLIIVTFIIFNYLHFHCIISTVWLLIVNNKLLLYFIQAVCCCNSCNSLTIISRCINTSCV